MAAPDRCRCRPVPALQPSTRFAPLEPLEPRCLLSAGAVIAADLPVILIAAVDTLLSEDGDSATLTFTRTGSLNQALTVRYSVDGTANTDISEAPIVFNPGQETVRVTVSAVNDDLIEGEETVIVTLLPHESYVVGPEPTLTLIVQDNDNPSGLPVVAVAAPAGEVSELGSTANFLVVRSGVLTEAVTVNYTIAGTAESGVDYQPLPGQIIIPAGSAQALIPLRPLLDDVAEPAETVQVVLSFGNSYVVGQPAIATAVLVDGVINPNLPLVEVSADPFVTEGGQPVAFTFTRSGPTDQALTVRFGLSGTVTQSDFQPLGSQVVIPAGASSVRLEVAAVDDDDAECTERLNLRLQPTNTYRLSGVNTATILFRDNDLDQLAPGLVVDLGDGAAKWIRYTDADGTTATLRLARGRAAVRLLGDNLTVQQVRGGGVIVSGGNVRLGDIHVVDSSLRSALKIVTKGGDKRVSVRAIRADNSLGVLSGKMLDLGCELFIQGAARSILLGSTLSQGQTTVWINGSGVDPVLTFDQARNVALYSRSPIKRLRANNWVAAADSANSIDAPSIKAVAVRGDFHGEVNLSDSAALWSLNTLKVNGAIVNCRLRSVSSVRMVSAQRLESSRLLIGLDPAAEQVGLPSTTSLFANRNAQLLRLTLRGKQGPSMIDSIASAWSIGLVDLREVDVSNDGQVLGVSAGRLKRATFSVDGQRARVAPAVGQALTEARGDLQLRQIGGIA